MPPKKKVDPEQLKALFDDWKTKDEFRVWTELQTIQKQFDYITETSPDLTGNWQIYLDKLYEVVQVFRAKTKLKEFRHEHIRSFFFAREDKDLEKGQVEKYIVDGFHCSADKEAGQASWHLRRKFIEIYRILEEFNDINPDNFQNQKKNMQKALNDFCKDFQKHVKSYHKAIYEDKLMMILTPLRNLLEVNRRLFFFDLKNRSPSDRLTNDFLLKADVDTYCVCLQECQKILYSQQHIVANPDVKRIFNKLNFPNWQTNKIETFYLMPLQKAFDKMRVNLLCLMVKGINYYKIPLHANKPFLDDLKDVISCELIAEHLLGDLLKKDQINFMFNVASVIFDANSLAREYILARDPNSIEGAVPKLVVYMTILHMRRWLDRKAADQEKLQKEKAKLASKNKGEEELEKGEEKDKTLSNTGFWSPDKRKQDDEAKRQEMMQKALEEQQKQQEAADQEKYGRYWVWDFYCDAHHRALIENCVEQLRHVNPAVQQDIQDEIIREGMIPRKDRQNKELKEASEALNKLRSKDNANLDSKMRRPPELWNYPKIVEEKHDFRSIADPKKCYIDGRIEHLEKQIKIISEHLVQYRPQSWKELVNRVVDALKGEYNANPSAIDAGK